MAALAALSNLVLAGVTSATPLFSPALDPTNVLISSGCGTTGPTSCHNITKQSDLCCFESPGGLILQVQFWDTDPSTGPDDSWTIHGLWPDNCDGTYEENCDPSRDYTDISSLLTEQGAATTLAYMEEYWLNDDGTSEELWEHEWATHGTCYSTLEPSCLPKGSAKGAEAVAFFETVVSLFKTLPTYTWLEQAGITPSSSKTYTLAEINAAIESATGVTPSLDCDNGNEIYQISYYYNLKGSVIDGDFVAIDAAEKGSCDSTGLKYLPKSGSGSSGGGGGSGGGGSGGGTGDLPSEAEIYASSTGGLLSKGTWSTQTLATYHFSGSVDSFTMTTSKGDCGVSGNVLSCGSGVSSSTFSAVTSGSDLLLAYNGQTEFSSDETPSGEDQETVYVGSGHSKTYTLSIQSS